ncbi:MAG: hypothetical protein ACI8PT_001381 [Gammaproteobacteria bacterium]|jgi:hypothetical protein
MERCLEPPEEQGLSEAKIPKNALWPGTHYTTGNLYSVSQARRSIDVGKSSNGGRASALHQC